MPHGRFANWSCKKYIQNIYSKFNLQNYPTILDSISILAGRQTDRQKWQNA